MENKPLFPRHLERLLWLVACILLLVAFVFKPETKAFAISLEAEKYLQNLHEAISFVQNDFVDPIDEKKLYTGAIQGTLQSLGDPHTRFLDREEFNELQNETKGSFGGIGVEVTYIDQAFVIVSPIEGTPAWKAGLLPQDRIIEINQKSTKFLSLSDSINMMRGEIGSSLSMKIERKGLKEPFIVNLVRELIKIQYLKGFYFPGSSTSYIKLAQFMGRDTTTKEFTELLDSHIKLGAKHLVLDLRMNPGGLLDLAIQLSDLFLPENLEIVSVKGKNGILVRSFKSSGQSKKYKLPVAILLNSGSASASEILAGALQDNKRAIVLGNQSFGKGSVQSIFPLSHGTGIAVTIQKYYTPSGKSIHGKGITPDKVVNSLIASDDDNLALTKLQKKNKLRPFLSAQTKFDETTVSDFKNLLKEENLTVDDAILRTFLYSELRSVNPAPNVELDLPLKEAIKSLKE